MQERLKVHKIYIPLQMMRYFYILILPVLQQLLSPTPALSSILWLELGAIVLLFLLAFLQWKSFTYAPDEKGLTVRRGFLLKTQYRFAWVNISTVDYESGILYHLLGAVKLRLDTSAGSRRKADMLLPLSRRGGERFCAQLCAQEPIYEYRSSSLRVAGAAAASSNAALGLLIASPLVNHIGKVLGQEIVDQIYGTISLAQAAAARYMPPFFGGIAYVMLAGWCISFLQLWSRHVNFRLRKTQDWYIVSRGLLVKRRTYIQRHCIRSMVLRTTSFMQWLRLVQVKVCCAGYGKERGELAVIIPCEKKASIDTVVSHLEEYRTGAFALVPERQNRKFTYLWHLIMLAIALAVLAGTLWLWHSLWQVILSIASLPLLYLALWLFAGIRGAKKIGISADFHTFCAVQGLSIVVQHIPKGALSGVRVQTSPGGRQSNRCDITLILRTEKRHRYLLRGLRLDAVETALRTFSCDSDI